jgi:hypothetical protein
MNDTITITVINILISTGFFVGVYKNKIDTFNKFVDKIRELEIKIARLDEKINFLIDKN